MLTGKKAQMFTYLLVISTVIVLGTALYFLASKSAEFEGSLGRQPYAATKAYYANNKLLTLYQSMAQEHIDEIVENVPLLIKEPTSCGQLEDVHFWIKDDQNCVPNIMEKIQRDFNKQFTPELDKVNTLKLSKESLVKFERLKRNYLGGAVLEEVYLMQVVMDDPISYSITPNIEELVLTANNPWVIQFRDAIEGKKYTSYWGLVKGQKGTLDLITAISQYPNFRVKSEVNFKFIKNMQDAPKDIIFSCQLEPTSKLKACIDKKISNYNMQGIASFSSRIVSNRDVIIIYEYIGTRNSIVSTTPLFAVRIPDQGAYRITSFSADYKGDNLTAFYFDEDEPIVVRGSVNVPQIDNIVIEICMREKVDEGKLQRSATCPGNLKIFENKQFTSNTQGTISADQTNIDFEFTWGSQIPKLEKTFEFTLKVRSNVGTPFERAVMHNQYILVSR